MLVRQHGSVGDTGVNRGVNSPHILRRVTRRDWSNLLAVWLMCCAGLRIGVRPLDPEEAKRYWEEQGEVGRVSFKTDTVGCGPRKATTSTDS